jgi:hypothetical protein
MADFYDARGNTYFVASPDEIRGLADLPRTAADACGTRERWAVRAIERICGRPNASKGAKKYLSDGLLVGPFPEEYPPDRAGAPLAPSKCRLPRG